MQIRNFIHNEAAGSIFLIAATILALLCANTAMSDIYSRAISASAFWINDGLMTLFFFVVGLEIKRELVRGELSTRAKALQPILAAIGGMVVPVIFFLLVNYNSPETLRGWAVPCATDIAFALGVLALLGSRIPAAIKILLTAIAIIDDLIAILVIALFYTDHLQPVFLVGAILGMAGLYVLNRSKNTEIALYVAMGVLLWFSFLKAGIHPTLAGVATAMAIPAGTNKTSLLTRTEKFLHPWIVFGVVPIFAFANAGLHLTINPEDFKQKLTLGIVLGLMAGKPIGIMAGLLIGHLTGIARKAAHFDWNDYFGTSLLCGIGFTMALFIGELGFDNPALLEQVKLGVMCASFAMAIAGYFVCRFSFPNSKKQRKSHV